MFPLLKIYQRTLAVTQMYICGLEIMQNVYKPNMAIDEISLSH